MSKQRCGGTQKSGPKTVSVKKHKRSTPSDHCHGPGKPGPKTVRVKTHKRSKP